MDERSRTNHPREILPAREPASPETEPELVAEAPAEASGEPPVVARLVVEVRSDGRVTVARGAMEDQVSGAKVAIEARGDSPLALALSLARQMFRVPRLARRASRGLLPGRSRRRR